jgi:hypothetical protein
MPIILATREAEIGRMVVRGQPKQKVHESPSQTIAGYSDMCPPLQATWVVEIRRIIVPGQPG